MNSCFSDLVCSIWFRCCWCAAWSSAYLSVGSWYGVMGGLVCGYGCLKWYRGIRVMGSLMQCLSIRTVGSGFSGSGSSLMAYSM